ncbi:MAG: acyl-CoA thioester hydrolase [Thermoleophilaceae bacterium]|nr:acyl-CoA thioester hydrolase [Thermoleophilaceae bacterium]
MRSERYGGGRTEVDARASALAGTAITLRRVSEVFTHRLRVRYGECDPQGVVFNANWLGYFDVVITELWRELIGDYSGMVEQGADMMVAEAGIRFRGPARFDDVIEFDLSVTRMGNTALSTRIEATVGGAPAVEGTMRHVFVEPGTNTKRAIPEEIRAALEPLLVEEEPAAALDG